MPRVYGRNKNFFVTAEIKLNSILKKKLITFKLIMLLDR